MNKVYCYSRCTTCKKALKWLDDNKISYDRAESGDIVKAGGHYLMIIDRLDQNNDGADDAYLTYEMWAPHLTFLILTFKQIHGREFFSMDAFFDNTGRNKKKAAYSRLILF